MGSDFTNYLVMVSSSFLHHSLSLIQYNFHKNLFGMPIYRPLSTNYTSWSVVEITSEQGDLCLLHDVTKGQSHILAVKVKQNVYLLTQHTLLDYKAYLCCLFSSFGMFQNVQRRNFRG